MPRRTVFPFWASNALLILQALAFLTIGGYMQRHSFTWGVLFTEYLIVFLPVIILVVFKRMDFKESLMLNRISLPTIGRIMLLALCLLPIIFFVNMTTMIIMTWLGHFIQVDIPIPDTLGGLGMSLALISLSAGLCEETLFRGMVLGAYKERVGPYWGIIFAAILFGLFHFNPVNAFGPMILGLVFGYLVLVTRSLYAGIIAHMTNNGIAVLLSFWGQMQQAEAVKAGGAAAKVAVEQAQDLETILSTPSTAITILIIGFIFACLSSIPVKRILLRIKADHWNPKGGDYIQLEGKCYTLGEGMTDEEGRLCHSLHVAGPCGAIRPLHGYGESDVASNVWIESKRLKKLATPLDSFFEPVDRLMPHRRYFLPLLVFLILYAAVLVYIMIAL